jgi:hypothetical protein
VISRIFPLPQDCFQDARIIFSNESKSKYFSNLGNYANLGNDQQQPSYGGPRSAYNDLGPYPPGSGEADYKRYLNTNIKQII